MLNHQSTQKLKLMGYDKFNIIISTLWHSRHLWTWKFVEHQQVKINISYEENDTTEVWT